MTRRPFPVASPPVVLRRFVPEDAPKIYAMSRETGLRTWLPDQVYDSEARALEVLRSLIDAYRDPGTPVLAPYVLAVGLVHAAEPIGHVGLSPIEGQVEVGYAIEDEHRGRGYATEAVGAMASWAMERFDLPRVLGIVAAENVASCRVLERAGFELVTEAVGRLHGRAGLIRTYHKNR